MFVYSLHLPCRIGTSSGFLLLFWAWLSLLYMLEVVTSIGDVCFKSHLQEAFEPF